MENKPIDIKEAIKLAESEIKEWQKFLATARKRLKKINKENE